MDVYEIRLDRLSQLLGEMYGKNKTTLANRLNIQPSYLSRFSAKNKANHRHIGDRLARRIEAVSGKPNGWLDHPGESESMALTMADGDLVEPANLGLIIRIPIVGDTQAGRDGYWERETDYPDAASEFIDTPSRDREAYGLRIRGSSMWPRMREGDVLSLSPSAECHPGDYVVIRTSTGETLVKELVVSRRNEVTLNGLGSDEPRIVLPVESIELMHKVTAIMPGSMIIPR